MERLFLRHPRALGESYFEHQWAALRVAALLFGAAMACLVHAIVPHFFQTTASGMIGQLHLRLSERHGRSSRRDAPPLRREQHG